MLNKYITAFKMIDRNKISDNDFFWLIGILEADGGFVKPRPDRPHSPRISVAMQDEDTIAKVSNLIGTSYRSYQPSNGRKLMYRTDTSGRRAAEIMILIREYMSIRRKGQIDKLLSAFSERKYCLGEKHHNSSLTSEDVFEIRELIGENFSDKEIGNKFGVTDACIWAVRNGKTWSWL